MNLKNSVISGAKPPSIKDRHGNEQHGFVYRPSPARD